MGFIPPPLPLTLRQFQQELQLGHSPKEIAHRWHGKRYGDDKPHEEGMMTEFMTRVLVLVVALAVVVLLATIAALALCETIDLATDHREYRHITGMYLNTSGSFITITFKDGYVSRQPFAPIQYGVEGFDRKKRGSWDLLFLALRDCVGSRNKPKGEGC